MKLPFALKPPVFEDDDKTRAASLLYYILLFSIAADVLITLVVLLTASLNARYIGTDFGFGIGLIFLLWLLHRGNVRLIGILISSFLWLMITYLVFTDSGILSPVFAGYIVVILIAGLVMNMRWAVSYTVLSCAVGLGLVYAAGQGNYATQIGDASVLVAWLDYAGIFSLVTFCLMVSLGALRKVHERVVRSEEGYRDLFESNPLPTWVLDLGTMTFTDANCAAVEQYGYECEEIRQRKFVDIFAPEDMSAVTALMGKLQRGEVPNGRWNQVWRHRKKDGTQIHVELSFYRLTYLGHDAVMMAVYDFSARIQAEEALRVSEERYRVISELATDDVYSYVVYPDGTYTQEWVMGSFTKLTGYAPDEIQNTFGAYHPDDQKRAAQDVKATISGETTQNEYRVITKQGEMLWIEIRRFPIKDAEQKRVVRFIGVARDITQQKREVEAKNEAERLNLELEKQRELLVLKENFIAMMSHEFRTPLALILSSKETLQHYADRLTDERRQEKLQQIEDQVRHVIRLLDDVLTMGKATAGKLEYHPVPLDLTEFCQQMMDEMRITDKNVHEFSFEVQGEFTGTAADPQLLQHILVNLLSNAIKYSPRGSMISVSLSKKDNLAIFTVCDQGIGIPLDDQAHLFETFHRAQNAKFTKGTGLGLAIVKQSVEVHGGHIEFHSIEGEGTTFTVTLPVYAASQVPLNEF